MSFCGYHEISYRTYKLCKENNYLMYLYIVSMIDAKNLALFANTPAQVESLQYNLKQAARDISL